MCVVCYANTHPHIQLHTYKPVFYTHPNSIACELARTYRQTYIHPNDACNFFDGTLPECKHAEAAN